MLESGLFDLAGWPWARAIAAADVEAGHVPAVVQCTTPMGVIDPAAAEQIGLAAGAALVVGVRIT